MRGLLFIDLARCLSLTHVQDIAQLWGGALSKLRAKDELALSQEIVNELLVRRIWHQSIMKGGHARNMFRISKQKLCSRIRACSSCNFQRRACHVLAN